MPSQSIIRLESKTDVSDALYSNAANVSRQEKCWSTCGGDEGMLVERVLASTRVVWLQFGEGSIQVHSLVDRKHRKVVSQGRRMSCVYSRIEHAMRT